MKRLHSVLLGGMASLLFSACSQDLDQTGPNPGEEVVRIQLEAPEAMQLTRSVVGTNSAKGGLTNVDWTKYDVRYQLAVYSEDGTQQLIAPQSKVYDTYGPATFEFRLTPNTTYKFVAWADFVTQGSEEDLHYNTADFTNISIITDNDRDKTINDESRDAFFVTKNIEIGQTFNESLTLKRPFAKIRVVTTDWDESNGAITKQDNFKITYHDCKRFSGLNAVSGEAIGESDADASTVYVADIAMDGNGEKFYEGGYDATSNNRTLIVDYLVATSDQQAIHFKLDMLAGTTPIISRDFTTNIPIQRNYLTTLIGNLLSVGGSITIDIDENFDGTENTVEVKDPQYITYTATEEMDYNDRFWGTDLTFIPEQCTYNAETGEGKWAYTGTVTQVESSAFNGETTLRSIILPEGITYIGSNAFNNSSLEAITLPESLEEIDQYAFSKTNLTEIVIPANVELLGSSAFQGASSPISPLKKVVFEGNKIHTIESNTFQDCQNLQEVQLPEGLTTIKYNAFQRCYALEEITIPDAVTVIEKQVFSQCEALKRVNLGTQLESIGNHAFNECLALETIVCPDESPATLGEEPFPISDSWGSYTANYKIYVPDDKVDTYRAAWPAYWDASSWVPTKVIYPISSMPTE